MSDPQRDTSLPTEAEFSFVYDAQQCFVVCVSDDDEIQQLRQAVARARADSPASSVGLMPTPQGADLLYVINAP